MSEAAAAVAAPSPIEDPEGFLVFHDFADPGNELLQRTAKEQGVARGNFTPVRQQDVVKTIPGLSSIHTDMARLTWTQVPVKS